MLQIVQHLPDSVVHKSNLHFEQEDSYNFCCEMFDRHHKFLNKIPNCSTVSNRHWLCEEMRRKNTALNIITRVKARQVLIHREKNSLKEIDKRRVPKILSKFHSSKIFHAMNFCATLFYTCQAKVGKNWWKLRWVCPEKVLSAKCLSNKVSSIYFSFIKTFTNQNLNDFAL